MRTILVLAVAAGQITFWSAPVRAADYTVADGDTNKVKKSVKISGQDKVTVGKGGTLQSSDDAALEQKSWVDGIVIDNKGTITSTASDGRAIRFKDGSTMRFEIRNATGAMIGANQDAIQVKPDVTAGRLVVTNDGVIESRGVNASNGQAIDFGSVRGDAEVVITNTRNGVIRAADSDAIRVGARATTISNFGQIIGNNHEANSGADGISFESSRGGTVLNYAGGLISGGRHGINFGFDANLNSTASAVEVTNRGVIEGRNGSGIGSDASGIVINYGRITGAVDNIPGVANGDGDGIDIDYKATIVNYGIIEGTGAKGSKDGHDNRSEGVAIGGGSVDNKAGARITGLDNGITVDDSSRGNAYSAVEIANAGLIQGTRGYGIYITSTFDNVVTNAGIITGGNCKAIVFGGGNDTLNIRTGSVINGTVDGGNGIDVINLDGDGVFAGSINFEKLNVRSGNWTLTGSERYAQGVTVSNAATLVAKGTLDAQVSVQAGGTLAGTGTVRSLMLQGRLAPGDGTSNVGTLTVNEDAKFGSDARLRIGVNGAGSSDKVHVKGAAALDGIVEILAKPGTWPQLASARILSADGGVQGRFKQVTTDLAFLTPSLAYARNEVTVTLARNDVRYEQVAATTNQRSVASALNALPPGTPLTHALLGLSASGARAAFSGLSGEGLSGATGSGIATGALFGNSVLGHATASTGASSAPSLPSPGTPGAPMGLGMTASPGHTRAVPDGRPVPAPSRVALWARGLTQTSRVGADAGQGAAAVSSRVSGLLGGADWHVSPAAMLGIAVGFSDGHATSGERATRVSSSGYHLAAYGVHRIGAFYVAGAASLSSFDNASVRSIAVFGAPETEKAEFDSRVAGVSVEAGQAFRLAHATLTPFAALSFQRYVADGYTETSLGGGPAGPLSLSVAGTRTDAVPLTLGLRVAHGETTQAGWRVERRASIAWIHNFETKRALNARLSNFAGTDFTVSGASADRDLLQLKAGVSVEFAPGVLVGGEIAADRGANTQAFSASGNLRWTW